MHVSCCMTQRFMQPSCHHFTHSHDSSSSLLLLLLLNSMHRISRTCSLIQRLSFISANKISISFPQNLDLDFSKITRSSIYSQPIQPLYPTRFFSPRLGVAALEMGSVENEKKKDRLPLEATKILQSLASGWDDIIDPNALQVIPVKGAMTNQVFQIKWPTRTERSRKVLVRIYGEGVDIFFDRENEIRTFEFMSKMGRGPRLLGRFSNGRIEEFIHARTLSANDLRDPETSVLIATKMKEFHNLNMPGSKSVLLWDRLRNYLSVAKRMSSTEEAMDFGLNLIEQEISFLENALSSNQVTGFCHNDLQYGNIMIDEETSFITIIDYEYACYNPIAFDIANHFCEMAADYHTETPHLMDYSKYPGYNERKRFLQVYLRSSGKEPSESEMELLMQEVEKYTLASHLFWGLWGLISELVNEIDFNYKEYARQRFQMYWLRKPELLGFCTGSVTHANSEIAYPPSHTSTLGTSVP